MEVSDPNSNLSKSIAELGYEVGEEGTTITDKRSYYIANVNDLINYNKMINEKGSTIKSCSIVNDIDATSYEWVALGTKSNPFVGQINGNGHTVKLKATTGNAEKCLALIGYSGSGTCVENITLDVDFSGTDYVAGILSKGVSGTTDITIKDVVIDGKISSTKYSAGLVDELTGTYNISNCVVNSKITTTNHKSGGICGNIANADGTIKDCIVTSDIISTGTKDEKYGFNLGGFSGQANNNAKHSLKVENFKFTGNAITETNNLSIVQAGVKVWQYESSRMNLVKYNCSLKTNDKYLIGCFSVQNSFISVKETSAKPFVTSLIPNESGGVSFVFSYEAGDNVCPEGYNYEDVNWNKEDTHYESQYKEAKENNKKVNPISKIQDLDGNPIYGRYVEQ